MSDPIDCNFCGMTECYVMIAGLSAAICDACVLKCLPIITEKIDRDSNRIRYFKESSETRMLQPKAADPDCSGTAK